MFRTSIILAATMLLVVGPASARIDPALPSASIQPMVVSLEEGGAETKDLHNPPPQAPPPQAPPATCSVRDLDDHKSVPCVRTEHNLRGQAEVPEMRPFRQFNSQRYAP